MNLSAKSLLKEIRFITKDNTEGTDTELETWLKAIINASLQKRKELKRFWEFIIPKKD
jgi:hypothetical protein